MKLITKKAISFDVWLKIGNYEYPLSSLTLSRESMVALSWRRHSNPVARCFFLSEVISRTTFFSGVSTYKHGQWAHGAGGHQYGALMSSSTAVSIHFTVPYSDTNPGIDEKVTRYIRWVVCKSRKGEGGRG